VAAVADRLRHSVPGAPDAEWTIAPSSPADLVPVLQRATEHGLRVLVWGGGTHQGYGHPISQPDIVVSTAHLRRTVAWEPDDLTLVVEAGLPVTEIEAMLGQRRQTAVLPERATGSTIGGVLAAGISGFRRARYGPTRDRVLEVTLVTGDGRLVRGGGRVVKNVTGYDLPRLVTGSLGSLGVIVSTCLKLWPLAATSATVEVEDAERAWAVLHRPAAVLDHQGRGLAYLSGTREEVDAQATKVGGTLSEGFDWPDDPAGPVRWSLRVPAAAIRRAIDRVPPQWRYLALYGVGEVRLASPDASGAGELRGWAESLGGHLVMVEAPPDLYAEIDPWGADPSGLDLQRRLVAAFDPRRVLNPGRLPGRI
jgi:glycolate oxidase FAD binding subunit